MKAQERNRLRKLQDKLLSHPGVKKLNDDDRLFGQDNPWSPTVKQFREAVFPRWEPNVREILSLLEH